MRARTAIEGAANEEESGFFITLAAKNRHH
jgi:hypothetical protein